MRVASLVLLLLLSPLLLVEAAPKTYWITFGGHQPRDPVYLMKINSRGEIIVSPTVVLKANQFGSEVGAAAIAHQGPDKLYLWRWGKDRKLYHAVVDKQTFKAERVNRIEHVSASDADTLHVTQQAQNGFLIFESSHSQLVGIALDPLGIPNGPPWKIVRKAPKQNDEACLAPDGQVVVSNRHNATAPSDKNDRVFAQQLNQNGRPAGASQLIAAAQDIEACDVSMASITGERLVAYMIDHGTDPEDIVVLQKVSSQASRIGEAVPVYSSRGRNQDDQNLALDPRRKFVVFTVDGEDFGCADRDVLVHLRLGRKGTPVGRPRLLAGCGFVSGSIVNIDLLAD